MREFVIFLHKFSMIFTFGEKTLHKMYFSLTFFGFVLMTNKWYNTIGV